PRESPQARARGPAPASAETPGRSAPGGALPRPGPRQAAAAPERSASASTPEARGERAPRPTEAPVGGPAGRAGPRGAPGAGRPEKRRQDGQARLARRAWDTPEGEPPQAGAAIRGGPCQPPASAARRLGGPLTAPSKADGQPPFGQRPSHL